MNPFYEPFPAKVRVGEYYFPIRTDFRAVLKMLTEMHDAKNPAGQLLAALSLYKEPPADPEEAVRAVSDFVVWDGEKISREGECKKTFSYTKDAPYIIADFLHFYGIDLASCRYLHWQKFQLLLVGLPGESETKQRIAYRSINAGKIRDRRERERILRIQRSISIEDEEADAGRIGELFASLM